MAARFILDLGQYDPSRILYDQREIYRLLPQKHEFMQLDGVIHLDHDRGEAIAYMDVRDDQWWCRAHIPGQPILPGVLMLEAGAHLAALMERYYSGDFTDFVGYGGVDQCKFRQTVAPPARLWILGRRIEARSRRIICDVQGVVDDVLVFEAKVTGLVVKV